MASPTLQFPQLPTRALDTVVIGTSLGEGSDAVVKTGLAVARAAGARVYLVHAVPSESLLAGYEPAPAPEAAGAPIAWRRRELARQIERLGIDPAELAGSAVRTGAPYRVITEASRQQRAGLIVVGATDAGPIAAELLGSTADRVLRKAACPVLLVRGDLAVPPRRVLAPIDLSSLSGDAFRCGLALLTRLAGGAPVAVRAIYALSRLEAPERREGEGAGESPAERFAAEELRRFVRENRPAGPVDLDTAVLSGESRFTILKELAERPFDLVVLGTHGRGGLDRLVLGSVATTVARRAPCSVLLVSPDAALAQGLSDAAAARAVPSPDRDAVTVG